MAAPKRLTGEQRAALLQWLAAEYDSGLIRKWCKEREWPDLSRRGITHYRKRWADQIAAAREQRHSRALTTGLALKEERVGRLKQHADELDAIKWLPDEKGRLWNEKAWRETLEDIAAEMGHRKQTVEHGGSVQLVVKGYSKVSPDDWDGNG